MRLIDQRKDPEYLDAVKRLGGKPRAYTTTCRNRKCFHKESMGAYAIAQLSMGHNLVFHCPKCGRHRTIYARAFRNGAP